jgi:hypothetical protein
MIDPMKTQPAPLPARPAPRLDEVRRILGRYRRPETQPRGTRAATLTASARKRGD